MLTSRVGRAGGDGRDYRAADNGTVSWKRR